MYVSIYIFFYSVVVELSVTITEPKCLKTDMQSSGNLSRSSNSPSVRVPSLLPQSQQSSRRLSLCSEIATHSSPIVFSEKRTKKPKAFSKRSEASITDDQTSNKSKMEEHRIDIGRGDEKSDLLGYVVYSGKLILDQRKNVPDDNNNSTVEKDSSNDTANEQAVAAKLTSKALVWGSYVLSLDDVVSVLNGLLSRDNQKEGISIPIGIIPAGSDNSLIWIVLKVRDPVLLRFLL